MGRIRISSKFRVSGSLDLVSESGSVTFRYQDMWLSNIRILDIRVDIILSVGIQIRIRKIIIKKVKHIFKNIKF